jgi:hypothetical protein
LAGLSAISWVMNPAPNGRSVRSRSSAMVSRTYCSVRPITRPAAPNVPRPPAFDTAAANERSLQLPIGANTIGASIPSRSVTLVRSAIATSSVLADAGRTVAPPGPGAPPIPAGKGTPSGGTSWRIRCGWPCPMLWG